MWCPTWICLSSSILFHSLFVLGKIKKFVRDWMAKYRHDKYASYSARSTALQIAGTAALGFAHAILLPRLPRRQAKALAVNRPALFALSPPPVHGNLSQSR